MRLSDLFRIEGNGQMWLEVEMLPGCPWDLSRSGLRQKVLVLVWAGGFIALLLYALLR